MFSLWEYVDIYICYPRKRRTLYKQCDFLRRQVNYLSVAMRTTYVFFTGVATAQSIINEGEEGTLGLVRFGFSLVAGTKGRRTCAN